MTIPPPVRPTDDGKRGKSDEPWKKGLSGAGRIVGNQKTSSKGGGGVAKKNIAGVNRLVVSHKEKPVT